MVLTRAAFQFIADTIADLSEDKDGRLVTSREALAEVFADALRETNGNFDRQRFIAAATASRSARG